MVHTSFSVICNFLATAVGSERAILWLQFDVVTGTVLCSLRSRRVGHMIHSVLVSSAITQPRKLKRCFFLSNLPVSCTVSCQQRPSPLCDTSFHKTFLFHVSVSLAGKRAKYLYCILALQPWLQRSVVLKIYAWISSANAQGCHKNFLQSDMTDQKL